jgi:hypothetical protein
MGKDTFQRQLKSGDLYYRAIEYFESFCNSIPANNNDISDFKFYTLELLGGLPTEEKVSLRRASLSQKINPSESKWDYNKHHDIIAPTINLSASRPLLVLLNGDPTLKPKLDAEVGVLMQKALEARTVWRSEMSELKRAGSTIHKATPLLDLIEKPRRVNATPIAIQKKSPGRPSMANVYSMFDDEVKKGRAPKKVYEEFVSRGLTEATYNSFKTALRRSKKRD